MNIEIHQQDDIKIAELTAPQLLVTNAEDGLQLLVDLYYQDFDKIILHEENITSDFFDLKTGLAAKSYRNSPILGFGWLLWAVLINILAKASATL